MAWKTRHPFCFWAYHKNVFLTMLDKTHKRRKKSISAYSLFERTIYGAFSVSRILDQRYLCPNNKVLTYRTTNRDGYREYKSDPKDCKVCPFRERCTQSQNCQKVVQRHVWQDYLEEAEHLRHTPLIKGIYERRKETIERCFADAKEKHGMRYTLYRGLAAVTKWVLLKFTAMNLKKYAIRKWREDHPFLRPLLDQLLSLFFPLSIHAKNLITAC